MAYQATFINRSAQFGQVDYDVMYSDDSQLLPDVRLHKSFSDKNDNPEYLDQLAATDIQNILAEQAAQAAYSPILVASQENLNQINNLAQSTSDIINQLVNSNDISLSQADTLATDAIQAATQATSVATQIINIVAGNS